MAILLPKSFQAFNDLFRRHKRPLLRRTLRAPEHLIKTDFDLQALEEFRVNPADRLQRLNFGQKTAETKIVVGIFFGHFCF